MHITLKFFDAVFGNVSAKIVYAVLAVGSNHSYYRPVGRKNE